MVRELIKPLGNTYLLNLPDDMVGKTVEIIAFEVESNDKPTDEINVSQNLQNIKEKYSRYPTISHDNYKFDRDDANNYE